MTGAPLTPAERRLRVLLQGYAALFLVAQRYFVEGFARTGIR